VVEINWTREAQVWLKDIHTYIATDNPAAAQRTIAGILARVQLLKTHPRLGHRYKPNHLAKYASFYMATTVLLT
jgi:plasmid stabilization system protein ParE